MVYIGIDVGGTGIKIGVVDEQGQLIHQGETPTLVGRPYQEIIADMGHCALKVLDEAKLTVDDVHSVGIGIPGIADAKTGNVIFCTNMGWKDVPLRSELQKYINKPVFIDNDATVAGFAESVAGVSKGTSSSVFLTLGTGVGGGIILDGKIVSGFQGGGGEVGHLPVVRDAVRSCNCGKADCVELAGSATGVLNCAKQLLSETDEPSAMRDIENLSAKDVCDCCAAGDALAQKCIDRAADALGTALACIGCIVNPEAFLFGGGMAAAGDILLEPIGRVYNAKVFPPLRGTPILQATLGNEAGITGAVRLVQIEQQA